MDVKLVVFRESGDKREFPLTRKVTTIGRKDDCDIRVPLSEISRHHAQLTVAGESVTVKDLGSANGTYLNNKRIDKEEKLAAGSHLVVGPVVFTVQINGEPADVRAVKTKLRSVSVAVTAKDSKAAKAKAKAKPAEVADELDPISALEALASSTDQTAIDAFDADDELS